MKHIFRLTLIGILIQFSLFLSCSYNIANNLNGSWVLDSVAYNGMDIKGTYMAMNVLFLNSDGDFQAPSTNIEQPVTRGKWRLLKDLDQSLILFESEDAIFNGTFEYKLTNDNNVLELFYEKTYILCSKSNY